MCTKCMQNLHKAMLLKVLHKLNVSCNIYESHSILLFPAQEAPILSS